MKTDILRQNENSWNALAEDFFGVTALPILGCSIPTEDELHLFPDLNGKSVFEMGCGSGHSLKWCAEHGAKELFGLDISEEQLKTAKKTDITANFIISLWKKTQTFHRIILMLCIRSMQSVGLPTLKKQ